MRFSPKALIFTRAWWAAGVGLGASALMNMASIGPLPPLMSVLDVSRGLVNGLVDAVEGLTYRLLSCTQACWLSFCELLRYQFAPFGFWFSLTADCFLPSLMSSRRMRNDVEGGVGKGL